MVTSPLTRAHRRTAPRSTGRLAAVFVASTAVLALLAGCSSSGLSAQEESLGGPSPAPATNMPDPAALTPAGTVVPAGEWAVVQLNDSSATPPVSTIAIRSGQMREGDADDLADVQVMNGTSESTAGTPFYVNYSWVLLEGSEFSSPVQRGSAPDRLVFDGDPSDYTGAKAVQLAIG